MTEPTSLSLADGLGGLLVFVLVLLLFPALRERMLSGSAQQTWQRLVITAITAGLIALALIGFFKHVAFFDAMPASVVLGIVTLAAFLSDAVNRATRRLRFKLTGLTRHLGHPDSRAARITLRIDQIDRLLPQTQCGQCGYPGCRPYAEAIIRGQADINQCPPGGETGVRTLAALSGRKPKPVNPDNGSSKPPLVALIIEADCIGCTKCIQACPVDAIVGAPKLMHTVIASLCTGCELCLPPCPVDCIDLLPNAGHSHLTQSTSIRLLE